MNFPPSLWIRALCCWSVFTAVPALQAQLAITEVMSSASTNLGTNVTFQRPDFWELTNFGTNTIDLTGYKFGDDEGIRGWPTTMFDGLHIGPVESIILFRFTPGVCTNAAQFRAWWGEGKLPANLRIIPYDSPGLSSFGDVVQIWRFTGESATLVDRVQLSPARRGQTFTYDPATGFLDSFSEAGEAGAFKAMETDDVGSPGTNAGPVMLVITQQPQSLTVDAGTPASFSVQANGLPRPRFQWQFNGIPILGATSNVFEISATETNHLGTYTVGLDNGLTNMLSDPAFLQINAILSPARIVVPPADLVVTLDQRAVFYVSTRGYPLPTFQWQFNGLDISGATGATLLVHNADFNDSGLYTVRVQNSLGSTNAPAILTVRPKANLVITEMMGSRSTNATVFSRADWWELTSFETYAVNLRGYRFNDSPAKLKKAVVITNDVIIQPGESVLFIQDITPEFFKLWWGEENLPEDVQFVRYVGKGITAEGDSMTLWNATTHDDSDDITRAEYVHLNEDFTPVRGISLNFWCEGHLDPGQPSDLGECGAIRAAGSADIGSPGYLTNHPPIAPRCLMISRNEQGVRLTWKTLAGKRYELLSKESLEAPDWTPLSQHTAVGAQLTITDTTATGAARRFYRLHVVPSPP